MRVIGGTFRSRVLQTPPGNATRPTSDRLRETLFNVLAPVVSGSVFLDLYAGSGAVGIEAASRGADEVWFAEESRAPLLALRANLRSLGLSAHVVAGDVATLLLQFAAGPRPADIVFLDPPYDDAKSYAVTLGALGQAASTVLATHGLVVAEHRSSTPPAERHGRLWRYRLLKQGEASLSFYRIADPADRETAGESD